MLRYRLLLFIFLVPILSEAQALRNGIANVTVNGVRHWVRIAGAEHHTIPLVILHGGPGGNHYVFERSVGRELEKFATVIYYEQRGSGRSAAASQYSVPLMVSDLEELRKFFRLQQMLPLGYSFGASLSLEYSLVYPERVKGLILESFATLQDSAVLLSQMANFYAQATKERRGQFDSILNSSMSIGEKNMAFWSASKREDVIRFLFYDPENGRKVFKLWAEGKIGNTGEVTKALMNEKRAGHIFDDAHRVTVPTLLLTGVADRNGALPSSLRLKEEIPNSTILFFEHSAHFPDFEQQGLFAQRVRSWLVKNQLL